METLTPVEYLECRRVAQLAAPIFHSRRWTYYEEGRSPTEDGLQSMLVGLAERCVGHDPGGLTASGRFVVIRRPDPEGGTPISNHPDDNLRFRIGLEL